VKLPGLSRATHTVDNNTVEFTGHNAAGTLVYGPRKEPLASTVTLLQVPKSVTSLTTEFLSKGARHTAAVPVDIVSSPTTTAEVTGFSPATALGVNFNGVPDDINTADLARTGTTWIRGFIDHHDFLLPADNPVKQKLTSGLTKLHNVHQPPSGQRGYKTIVNIKFNFEDEKLYPFPTTEAAINTELAGLNSLLTAIYPDSDILVIGNEPFIETPLQYRNVVTPVGQGISVIPVSPLVTFYMAAAQKVKAFQDTQTLKVPLYLGAYDSIWGSEPWQSWAQPLLQFTKDTPWLMGADLHLHVFDPQTTPPRDGAGGQYQCL